MEMGSKGCKMDRKPKDWQEGWETGHWAGDDKRWVGSPKT
jgi:hypothetical protein